MQHQAPRREHGQAVTRRLERCSNSRRAKSGWSVSGTGGYLGGWRSISRTVLAGTRPGKSANRSSLDQSRERGVLLATAADFTLATPPVAPWHIPSALRRHRLPPDKAQRRLCSSSSPTRRAPRLRNDDLWHRYHRSSGRKTSSLWDYLARLGRSSQQTGVPLEATGPNPKSPTFGVGPSAFISRVATV